MYLKSVENVITLGKLIGLLFLFCLPLLSILFLKTKRNDLARPVMGTIFLVILKTSIARRAKPFTYVARLSRPRERVFEAGMLQLQNCFSLFGHWTHPDTV